MQCPNFLWQLDCRRFTRVIRIQPLMAMNVFTKCHGNPSGNPYGRQKAPKLDLSVESLKKNKKLSI